MFTPRRLFITRLKHGAREQWRAWGSVMDWTVWLYIAIPAVLIGGGLYREAWQVMPEWAFQIPWTTLYPIAMLLLFFAGELRIFVHDGDRLFLIQRRVWLQAMKRYGLIYTIAVKTVVAALAYAALLPFLIKAERLTLPQLGAAYCLTLITSIIVALISHLVLAKYAGWRKWAIEIFCILVLAALYLSAMINGADRMELLLYAAGGGLLMLAALAVLTIRADLNFEIEVKKESSARLRSTELLMSQVIEPKRRRFKRPLLFRSSGRIFRSGDSGTVLAEMKIKSYLRSLGHLRVWVSLTTIGSYAVTLVPSAAAAVIAAALAMLGSAWLKQVWQSWMSEEFIAQFKWNEADERKGQRLASFWLLLAPVLIWSMIAGFKIAGLWGIVPAAIAGAAALRLFHR